MRQRKYSSRTQYAYQCSDGGKAQCGLTHERNDCTVRTLAIAAEIPYKEAHSLLASFGRKDGKGFAFGNLDGETVNGYKVELHVIKPVKVMAKSSFYNVEYVKAFKRPTLKAFLASDEAKRERLAITVPSHIFAVIDGVVHDSYKVGSSKRVWNYYTFTKEQTK